MQQGAHATVTLAYARVGAYALCRRYQASRTLRACVYRYYNTHACLLKSASDCALRAPNLSDESVGAQSWGGTCIIDVYG